MNTRKNRSIVLSFCSILSVLSVSSCLNEDYDLKKLDTNVTIGGENLTIPVGETEKMTIKELLSSADQDLVQSLEDGTYAIHMSDVMDLSKDLPDFNESLKVKDIQFNQNIDYKIDDIAANQTLFEGKKITTDLGFEGGNILEDLKVPAIEQNQEVETGLWEYAGKVSSLDLGLQPVAFNVNVPLLPSGKTLALPGLPSLPEKTVLPTTVEKVNISADCPKGLNSVSNIKFGPTSRIKVSMSVEAPFVKSGDIVPAISLDLSKILTLTSGSAKITLGNDFKLNHANQFKAEGEYYLSNILINENDWKGGKLNLTKEISMGGSLAFANIDADPTKLSNLKVKVSVDFLGIKVASADVDIEPITIEQPTTVPVEIEEIVLAEGIKSVSSVVFDQNSNISIAASVKNLSNISGMDMKLAELKLAFPQGLKIAGHPDGQVSYLDKDLKQGMNESIHVEGIEFASAQNGHLSFKGELAVNSKVVVSGKVNTANLPTTKENDAKFSCKVTSSLKVEDGDLVCDNVTNSLPSTDEVIKIELPSEYEKFGKFTVYPAAGSDKIIFDINLAKTDIAIQAEPLKIDFPDFIVFKDVNPAYNFNSTDNTINIQGDIPEQIVLNIDKFVISPVKSEDGKSLFVEDKLSVSGMVKVASGSYKISQFDALLGGKSSISLIIPEIKADNIKADMFSFDMDETVEFTILAAEDMPKELVSVKTATLQDVKANFNIAVKNMPSFGVGVNPNLDLVIELPKEIILGEDPRVKGSSLHVNGVLKGGKIAVDPVVIKGFDFSDFDFTSGKDLKASINMKGGVKVVEPTVHLEELSGRTIQINSDINIKNIKFSKIEGKVDYKLDPLNEEITLDELPEFMKDKNFVLDFANPYLKINAKTNMGVPVVGNLKLIPVYGGNADESKTVVLKDIAFPYTKDASKPSEAHFFIAGKEDGKPADYTWLKGDIANLIKRVPDNLKIVFEAGTDQKVESLIEPSAKYELALDYEFTVPLEFGKDLNLQVCDTISELPEMVADILESGTLKLKGEVISSLPVQMELELQLMAKDQSIIPLEEKAVQVIKACNSDGSETVSPLELTLVAKKGVDLSNLDAFKLNFTVTSGNVSGIPITDKSFVQAKLKLNVPGGITVDLKNSKTE